MRSRTLFASYSRKDREIVSGLCELLRVGGTRVFRDEDSIQPGKRWKAVLTKALQESECVLVFWSANSAPSPAVREEYTTAIQLDKDIAPVLLDETPLPEELRPFQWIDCRSFVKVRGIAHDLSAATLIMTVVGAWVGSYLGNVYIGGVVGALIGAVLSYFAFRDEVPAKYFSLDTLSGASQAKMIESFAERVFDKGRSAEPCAAPNGGPAAPVDNSKLTEGPPSVS